MSVLDIIIIDNIKSRVIFLRFLALFFVSSPCVLQRKPKKRKSQYYKQENKRHNKHHHNHFPFNLN